MAEEPADGQWSSMRISNWEPPAAVSASGDNSRPAASVAHREIVFDADEFEQTAPGLRGEEWKCIPGLGHSGNAIAVFPTTVAPIPAGGAIAQAPQVAYAVDFERAGEFRLTVELLPTHALSGSQLRFAIALGDESPRLVVMDVNDGGPEWALGVLAGSRLVHAPLHVASPGRHVLHIFGVDAGVVIDRLRIDLQTSQI